MKLLKHEKRTKGFTLVELMFVLLSFSLLMTALISITQGGMQSYRKGVAQTDMKEKLRRATYAISTDLRQAIPEPGASAFISPLRLDSAIQPVSDLNFRRYSYNGDNGVGMPNNPTTDKVIRYRFVLNNGNVVRLKTGGVGPTYDLIRTEIQGGTTKQETLADYLIVNNDNLTDSSHFVWQKNPMNTTLADYDTLAIKLIMRKDIGGQKTEELVFDTKATVATNVAMGS